MKKSGIEKYFSKRMELIELCLTNLSVSISNKNIHRIRVEIKKLSALYDLLNDCSKDFKRQKYSKLLSMIFKKAGIIRDLFLETEIIKKYAHWFPARNYLLQLQYYRLKKGKRLSKLINYDLFKELYDNHEATISHFSKIDKKQIDKFYNKKKKKIELLTNKVELTEKEVHTLRKRLKELYYTEKCLNYKMKKNDENKIIAFQNFLGEWHDYTIVREHLEKTIKKGLIIPAEKINLKRIHAKINIECRKKLEKLNVSKHTIPI